MWKEWVCVKKLLKTVSDLRVYCRISVKRGNGPNAYDIEDAC